MSRAHALEEMYKSLHGKDAFESRTDAEVSVNDDDYENPFIECIKDGHQCWILTKEEVLFDFIAMTHLSIDCS